MFDWVQKNRKVMQFVLFLIFLPFAFFGVDSYFRDGDMGPEVARMGDYRISQQEFDRALRDQQEQMRRALGGGAVDAAMLNSPQMRMAVLERLIQDRLLLSQAVKLGVHVSDDELRRIILSEDAFKENGQFSNARYEAILRNQNMTPVMFEQSTKRDLLKRPLLMVFGPGNLLPDTVAERLVRLSEQTRDIRVATVPLNDYLKPAEVDDAAVKAWYEANQGEFRVPEQVRLSYIVLSRDNLAAQVKLTPEELRQAYEQNRNRYGRAEEREASHILIAVAPDAAPEAREAARKKAEALAQQAREKPEAFAALAKAESQDPGSAGDGGNLGFLPKGATAKAFDDALFAMKPGQIAGPVETEFGFHVIKLASVRGGDIKPFEEARPEIEQELRQQRAAKRYAELAEQMSNLVYEQSDSLKPAAEALGLQVQESPWLSRQPVPGSPLGNERFLNAVFSQDVLKDQRNSESVEVAPGTLVAGRLLEHKPSSVRPLEEVAGDIRTRIARERALKRAAEEGAARLERLRKGESLDMAWGDTIKVKRGTPARGVPASVQQRLFSVDAGAPPAYFGVEDPSAGYHLVRIDKVESPDTVTAEQRRAVSEQIRQFLAQEEFNAYLARLRGGYEIKIKPDAVEKSQP